MLGSSLTLRVRNGVATIGGEMIVRLLGDDIGGQCALRQQGIAGDVPARDVTAFQQGDRHTDFVGALLLRAVRYG